MSKPCSCVADKTWRDPVEMITRGRPGRQRRMASVRVWHTREADGAVFWHWQDQRLKLRHS